MVLKIWINAHYLSDYSSTGTYHIKQRLQYLRRLGWRTTESDGPRARTSLLAPVELIRWRCTVLESAGRPETQTCATLPQHIGGLSYGCTLRVVLWYNSAPPSTRNTNLNPLKAQQYVRSEMLAVSTPRCHPQQLVDAPLHLRTEGACRSAPSGTTHQTRACSRRRRTHYLR